MAEWHDGILANIVREACKDESSARHWIILDGPVDTYWVESMNSVLDETKKVIILLDKVWPVFFNKQKKTTFPSTREGQVRGKIFLAIIFSILIS